MNANELIELLDKNAGDGDTPLRQAVTLLRQQQAEIEALKQRLFEMQNANIDLVKQFKGYGQQPNQDQIPEWWEIELRKAQEK